MAILRTVLWWSSFWIGLFFTLPLFAPVAFYSLIKRDDLKKRYVVSASRKWAKVVLFLAGAKIDVKGLENIPQDGKYCIVANHQGSFDIPLIMSVFTSSVGFIAKKELKMLPVFGWWMQVIGCIFLDRSNRRHAVEVIDRGAVKIAAGNPMVIFPEGTRSRGGALKEFKKGSLKLALKSRSKIVPVSINGSYKLLEANGYLITPAKVEITIHPEVDLSNVDDKERDEMAHKLKEIVEKCVEVI